jgi:hypothetical protein
MASSGDPAAVAAAPLVVSVPSAAPAPKPDDAAGGGGGGLSSLLSPSLWWSLAASMFDCSASPLPAPEESSASGESAFAPLQAPTPLRASALWKLQRAWYEERGLRAWSEATVPHFVTSNSFAARATVRGVAGGRALAKAKKAK